MKKPKTQSEELAERTAKANRIRREIAPAIGSPYRIHEATEKRMKDEDKTTTAEMPRPVPEDDYVYIAIKPCGDASAIIVDRPDYKRVVAKEIGGWIRDGYNVERVAKEVGLKRFKRCDHGLIKEQLKAQGKPVERGT